MKKDFINEVARIQRIERTDLIEKDLILHQLLNDLSKKDFFRNKFAFKGGTCLAKCYLDYFRFSEDIDFTWKNQSVFECKSQKEIRRYLSEVIDSIGKLFEEISEKQGLAFHCEKDNRKYVELTGGNKTCTFKIWYRSEVLDRETFLKVQMNFVEKICYPIKSAHLTSLVTRAQEELTLLFPEYQEYFQKIDFDVYDPREILAEKIRAILTRKGTKARDYVDTYLIVSQFGISLGDIFSCIIEKTKFTLDLYERYRKNLEEKISAIPKMTFAWGEEKGLLLKEINEKEFYRFVEELNDFLSKVIERLI